MRRENRTCVTTARQAIDAPPEVVTKYGVVKLTRPNQEGGKRASQARERDRATTQRLITFASYLTGCRGSASDPSISIASAGQVFFHDV